MNRDKPYQESDSYLFTVRVWREDVGSGRIEWRGKVQQVNSGEAHYFREWDALISHLLRMLSTSESLLETHINDKEQIS
jgi:hypothetical protein